jgi:ribosomal-protein-serine acetyltransferase
MRPLQAGEGLELALLEGSDAPGLFALVDAERARLSRWLPWVETTSSPADCCRWVQQARHQFACQEAVNLGVWHRRQLAGVVGLDPLDWSHRKAGLGYWLGARFEGRGLCTRACRALLEHGFSALGLNRVEVHCAAGNEHSRAVPRRLGFRCEGLLRQVEWLGDRFVDHEVYSLLAEEWQRLRAPAKESPPPQPCRRPYAGLLL